MYIPEYLEANPGAVESHWIPTDSDLMLVENYELFLQKRRELLAESTNRFLDSLVADSADQVEIIDYISLTEEGSQQLSEEEELLEVSLWMLDNGLPEGELNYELSEEDGNLLMIVDLAWPHGIKSDLSEPLALLIDESIENQELVNRLGYRYYTVPEDFKAYIEEEYLV